MLRAKSWAHKNGHIPKDGRGRMPKFSMKDGRELTAVLLEAKNSGVQFSDWPKGEVTVTQSKDDESKTEVTVKRDPSESTAKVIADVHIRFPEDDFKAYEFVNGKKSPVSLRECCNTCRVSLMGHMCDEPTYLNLRKVFIVRK